MRLHTAIACFFLALFGAFAHAQAPNDDRRVVFVMLDGLRWQEVFRGADSAIVDNPEFFRGSFAPEARARFVDVAARREALMPFVTMTMARDGALIGDRDAGSCAQVTNDRWFSYPGYNEALTGRADPRINSNDYPNNPNVTVLEWLNRRSDFAGRVAAATSWDAFGRIINAERSGVPVNAGLTPLSGDDDAAAMYNQLMSGVPVPWKGVRLDAFTHQAALRILREQRPRVLFVSYDETDDFAHDGDYVQYLFAAYRADGFLAELWNILQSDPAYAGRTTLIVTVDHGRGNIPGESWRHHYSPAALAASTSPLRERFPEGIVGSNETWIAALGPGVRAGERRGAAAGACAGLNQIAATALTALGLDWRAFDDRAGAPLDIFAPAPARGTRR